MNSTIDTAVKSESPVIRDKSLDVAKGLMMASVVAGHISSFPFGEVFYYYHIAGFFLLSGFFFNYFKYSKSFTSFIISRKKLILQYFGYALFFIAMHNVFIIYGLQPETILPYEKQDFIDSIINSITVPSEPMMGAMWFIPALIIMQVIFYFLNMVTDLIPGGNKTMPTLIVVLFFFGWWIVTSKYITNNQLLYKNIPNAQYFVYLPFFYVGFLLKQHGLSFLKNAEILISTFAIIALTYSTIRPKIYMYGEVNPFLFITLSFVGISFVISLSHYIKIKPIVNVLKYIGENTIHILALHFLFFKLATFILISLKFGQEGDLHMVGTLPDNGLLAILLYLACGIFGPLLLVECYRIIKTKISSLK